MIAFVVSICGVSCVRQTVDPAVSSVAPPSPVENGSDAIVEQGSDSHFEINEPTEVIPDDNGEHDWSLVSFVTEESEIPFAGVFVCKDCKVQTQKSIIFKDIDIPLVSVSGDLTEISKENKVKAAIRFSSNETSFFCAATMKWQGDGSLAHPKKNYSVALYDDAFNKKKKVEVNKEWGAESKYCLKANYAEPTFVRNLVLSDLYGLIAHDADYVDEYSELINGGAIDGFPILLYINGQYEGVYNWNIPKDKWLLGMGDDKDAGEAILCGSATQLNDRVEGITVDESIKGYWEIEYCNKAFRGNNGTDWAVDSFNEMLAFVKNADKETMRARASEFLNVDRALDVLLMSLVLAGP
ncbi:MAG: CotH kinase family protein, partial [Clostridia bacterium]|nr:CotH kinase family protein [Clostridia bacterium]